MSKLNFKRIMAAALVILTIAAMALPTAAYSGNYCTAKTKDTVYLRTKATSSTSSKYLVEGCNTIPANTTVDVLAVSGDYFKIEYNNYQGYVKISQLTIVAGSGTTAESVYFRKSATSSTKASNRVSGCETIPKGMTVTITGASGSFFAITYGQYSGYARMRDIILTWTSSTGTAADTSGAATGPNNGAAASGGAGLVASDSAAATSATSGIDQSGYKPSYTAITPNYTGKIAYLDKIRKQPNSSTAGANVWTYIPGGSSFTVMGSSGTSWLFVSYNGVKGFLPKDKVLTEFEYAQKYESTPTPTANNVNFGLTEATATPTVATTANPGDVYTTATQWTGTCKELVILRATANKSTASDNVRTRVPSGATVTVLGSSGDFYYISYGTYVGFARKVDIVAATTTTTTTTTGSTDTSAATTPTGDVWGSIQVPGTVINYKIYSNATTSSGAYKYGGYDYICALTPYANPIAVISGHNMRNRAGKSNSMFHELHHVQNALSNGNKCERCGAATGGAKTNIFNISYNGSTKWQVVLFYETPATTSASVKLANLLADGNNTTVSAWMDMQYKNCATYGGTRLADITSSKYMILVTCGDLKGGTTGARLYFVLAAVN